VIVFGQIARDLVLVVDAMPGVRQSADVYQRRELLGGKGANQAVTLAQGGGPQRAARLAVAAAGATVGHPGGRPSLTPKAVQDQLTLLAESTA
jgi:sugar/nucleoside kinase (ribokinase family)